jgi:hypothetical protein
MEILRTKNYEMFTFKKENRELNYNKVASLKSKLLDDGRQIMPIICNKEMEIIDGQHRFQALKVLDWDVMYYVDDQVSIKDLISINNTQKSWGMTDFVHYYASLGNESYVGLEKIWKKYEDIPLKAVLAAVSGGRYIKERYIKSGDTEFTSVGFKEGEEALEFLKNIKDSIKVKITGQSIFFYLMIKTYYLNDIDRDRLFHAVVSRYGTENYGNSEQCAIALEHWYNFKTRTYRYISNEILPKR